MRIDRLKDPIAAFELTKAHWKKVHAYIKGSPAGSHINIEEIRNLADSMYKGTCPLCLYTSGGESLTIQHCKTRCLVYKIRNNTCLTLNDSYAELFLVMNNPKRALIKYTNALLKCLNDVTFAPLMKYPKGHLVFCTYKRWYYIIAFPFDKTKPAYVIDRCYMDSIGGE